MAEAGKGDKQRPTDYEAFARNFEAIFGGKTKVTEQQFNNPPPQNEQPQTHRAAGSAPQPRPHN